MLVVDDDDEMCAMLNESKEQFAVELAHDGEAALRAVAGRTPDILLLDVAMPSLGGFEVLRKLRSESSVPVLMLTARDEYGDRIHGLELGADDWWAARHDHIAVCARPLSRSAQGFFDAAISMRNAPSAGVGIW